MKTNLIFATLLTAGMAFAQVVVPDGTKIRVKLEQNLSSETAELGQTVDFRVTQDVQVGDTVIVADGAHATGSIVQVEPRRRMGRSGKLDFSIERVQMTNGKWMNVRYTPQRNHGKGNGVTTGVLAAGIAVVFWPAAPFALLVKGHDATIIKGRTYDVFSDDTVTLNAAATAPAPTTPAAAPALPAAAQTQVGPTAAVSITANQPGAEIEIDGNFVGSAPTTVQLTAGVHKISVHDSAAQWTRDIQITGGTVNIAANLTKTTK